MPIGRALLIAFGLASLVLGWIYLEWRSQRPDRAGSISRRLLEAVTVSLSLGTGIGLLLLPGPNRLFSVGAAIFIGSKSLPILANWCAATPSLAVSKRALFIAYCSANAAGGTLWSAGAAIHGGVVGGLAAIMLLGWAIIHGVGLWAVFRGLPADDAVMGNE